MIKTVFFQIAPHRHSMTVIEFLAPCPSCKLQVQSSFRRFPLLATFACTWIHRMAYSWNTQPLSNIIAIACYTTITIRRFWKSAHIYLLSYHCQNILSTAERLLFICLWAIYDNVLIYHKGKCPNIVYNTSINRWRWLLSERWYYQWMNKRNMKWSKH